MALVPSTGNTGNEEQYGANATIYFTQLLQEEQQINVFINNWTLENAAEAEAEARHRMLMDLIYTEAEMAYKSSFCMQGTAGRGEPVQLMVVPIPSPARCSTATCTKKRP